MSPIELVEVHHVRHAHRLGAVGVAREVALVDRAASLRTWARAPASGWRRGAARGGGSASAREAGDDGPGRCVSSPAARARAPERGGARQTRARLFLTRNFSRTHARSRSRARLGTAPPSTCRRRRAPWARAASRAQSHTCFTRHAPDGLIEWPQPASAASSRQYMPSTPEAHVALRERGREGGRGRGRARGENGESRFRACRARAREREDGAADARARRARARAAAVFGVVDVVRLAGSGRVRVDELRPRAPRTSRP